MRPDNFCFPEKADLNQYWYSRETVNQIVNEIESVQPNKVAFLSTPSLFFKSLERNINSFLFEYDSSFKRIAGDRFVFYDFNLPEDIVDHRESFDLIIIDPPFISAEVIEAYAKTCRILSNPDVRTRVMISSIAENSECIRQCFDRSLRPVRYMPCIPNLVYQYSLFVNYDPAESSGLLQENPALMHRA
jgi:hypothetical protein